MKGSAVEIGIEPQATGPPRPRRVSATSTQEDRRNDVETHKEIPRRRLRAYLMLANCAAWVVIIVTIRALFS